jgi:hypothetical protein
MSDKYLPKEIAYIKIPDIEFGWYYKPLNPTGRWKLKKNLFDQITMFVEHKTWIFKHWISEHDIIFGTSEECEIFDCENK